VTRRRLFVLTLVLRRSMSPTRYCPIPVPLIVFFDCLPNFLFFVSRVLPSFSSHLLVLHLCSMFLF
jgi:hypothetical protein